jgi:hypothetical protein
MPGRHRAPSPSERRREARRIVETSEYAAMMIRVAYGYGRRVSDDPAGLAHLRSIEDALRDAVNLGIFQANEGGKVPYSLSEIGRVLEISKEAVFKRKRLGEQVAIRLSAGAVVRIADIRQARASALAAAGVEDRTGSPAELRAAAGLQ